MWQKNVRYLDYNASSGVLPSVKEKLIELLSDDELLLANPTSRHRLGQKTRRLIYESTLTIADSLGSQLSPDQFIFTASGTEANQTVIRSMAKDVEGMLIGSGEHSASHDLLSELSLPFLREIPLLSSGTYSFDALEQLLSEAKSLGLKKIGLSLFWANNETGVLTDADSLFEVISRSDLEVLLHLDGAQVWGKLPFDLSQTRADFVTFSSHKIGAPAGVGMVFKKSHVRLHPLVIGTQNKGLRGGTENTLGLIATARAAELLNPSRFIAHTRPLLEHLEQGLKSLPYKIPIWGEAVPRISNTSRFSFSHFKSYENWVELLDLRGFAVSHGSACKAQVIEPSRVLLKMGVSREDSSNSIRVSFGESNRLEDVTDFLFELSQLLASKSKMFYANDKKGVTE